MPLLIGTSGWQYRDWRGQLYPPGVPQRRWLGLYAERFSTVENNSAFYRLPAQGTFADWRDGTPPGFVMAVKASRYLTHLKRLRDPEEPVARLLERLEGLGDRLGPVLLQLSEQVRADVASLDDCLACFPSGIRVAVELRHPSWWEAGGELRDALERRDAALCWADRGSRPVTPLWRTASWGYLRLHGGAARPRPRYGPQALASWVRRVHETWPDRADVHVYFNNDTGGAALADAEAFTRAAVARGRTVYATGAHAGLGRTAG